MSAGDALGEIPLPKTIDELRLQARATKRCQACRQKPATHTVSLTLAELGAGRGSTAFTIPKVPVCESCGAQVAGIARRALKT